MLRQALARGDHYDRAILEVASPQRGGAAMRFELKEVMVSSFTVSGGEQPVEFLSLNFAKIEC